MSDKRIDITDGIPTRVRGIPCFVYLTDYVFQPPWKGSAHTCPSDLDYYGYEDMDYALYNLHGYRMRFLERLMSEEDKDKVFSFISKYMTERRKNKNDL